MSAPLNEMRTRIADSFSLMKLSKVFKLGIYDIIWFGDMEQSHCLDVERLVCDYMNFLMVEGEGREGEGED